MELLHEFRKVLRDELADLPLRNELDLARALDGMNRFREGVVRSSRTIATTCRCIDEVSLTNPGFGKEHRLAKSVMLELVRVRGGSIVARLCLRCLRGSLG